MAVYRQSRNFEASIVTFLTAELLVDWSGVAVEKSFAKVASEFGDDTPVVCVQVGITTHQKAEIGTDSTVRDPLVIIDIFANNDGQRLDLKDYIIEKVKSGMTYYAFTVVNNIITAQVDSGNIVVKSITDTPIDLDADKQSLDKVDRYRHRITLTTTTNIVEV